MVVSPARSLSEFKYQQVSSISRRFISLRLMMSRFVVGGEEQCALLAVLSGFG